MLTLLTTATSVHSYMYVHHLKYCMDVPDDGRMTTEEYSTNIVK
jgi:hypothetical protein